MPATTRLQSHKRHSEPIPKAHPENTEKAAKRRRMIPGENPDEDSIRKISSEMEQILNKVLPPNLSAGDLATVYNTFVVRLNENQRFTQVLRDAEVAFGHAKELESIKSKAAEDIRREEEQTLTNLSVIEKVPKRKPQRQRLQTLKRNY